MDYDWCWYSKPKRGDSIFQKLRIAVQYYKEKYSLIPKSFEVGEGTKLSENDKKIFLTRKINIKFVNDIPANVFRLSDSKFESRLGER